MTDYSQLVKKLQDLGFHETVLAADAIEALQARVAELEASLSKVRSERDALQVFAIDQLNERNLAQARVAADLAALRALLERNPS